jgi:nicotinate-nucleotide adenylyltransferase
LNRAVAVFGGTFDPVHFGHLRSALELCDVLPLAELRFMPAAEPPHREAPVAAAAHRVAMLELATAGESRFRVDERELRRAGPSYSVLSLRELRAELGADVPLLMIVGADALAGLESWYCWEEILDLAHILAIARPGWDWPDSGSVATLLGKRGAPAEQLRQLPAGRVCVEALRPQSVSSTAIRRLLQSGRSARYLTPDSVIDYIDRHGLYEPAANAAVTESAQATQE